MNIEQLQQRAQGFLVYTKTSIMRLLNDDDPVFHVNSRHAGLMPEKERMLYLNAQTGIFRNMIASFRRVISIVLFFCMMQVVVSFPAVAETRELLPAEGVITGLWAQTPFRAVVAADPEAWSGMLRLQPDGDEGILFVFTRAALHMIDCSILPFRADIIFISASNHIDYILEDCDPVTRAVSPEPVGAVLCVPAGFVFEHGIEPGRYIGYPRLIKLEQETPDTAEQRSTWIPVLEKTAEQNPGCLSCQLILAEHYLFQNRFRDVETLLLPLMKHRPGHTVIVPLAKALALQGEFDSAIELFEKALENRTAEKTIVFCITTTLQLSKPPEYSLEILKHLHREYPGNLSLAVAISRAYLKLNRFDQAQTFIENCIDTLGSNPELMKEKGNILLRKGEYPQAAKAYTQYLEAGPFDPDVRDYRSFITVHLLRKQLLRNRE
jgi:tetratricopeptide (TPR) repeat protein